MAALKGVKEAESVDEERVKLVFGRYSDAEMLAQLKRLALYPCNSSLRQKNPPLWNQMLRVRDAMTRSDNGISWRKRKLQQFAAEKSNQKAASKLSRRHVSHASSISCLLDSANNTKSSEQKVLLSLQNACSSLTFESVNGSDLLSRDNWTPSVVSFETLDDAVHNSSFSSVKGSRSRPLQPPRQSSRLQNFIGNHLQRFVIPVGPRFQADVPDWTVPAEKDNFNYEASNSENSKWLGTKVWPIEIGNIKVSSRVIGKGRPHSCSCSSPGTAVCVKRHVSDERLILQCDLGPAFVGWKFDEMGEQASKAWSSKEEATFKSLVKRKQLYGKKLLKHALKSLPPKTSKTIANYYFNVFIPRQLSLQNRSSNKLVNVNDAIAADINDTCLHKQREGQKPKGGESHSLRRQV